MVLSDAEDSDNDLHISVRYGDTSQVKEALRCKLSPNKIGLYQWSPLHEASNNGFTDIVRLLLENGGNPNLFDKLGGNTPLHYAAKEGHHLCLALLIAAGGDYEVENQEGVSPLNVATKSCKRIIEKKRVEKLIKMSLDDAKLDAKKDYERIEKSSSKEGLSEKYALVDQCYSGSLPTKENSKGSYDIPQHLPIAWRPQSGVCQSVRGTMGQLHVSFEYHSKKDSLKIRLWKLTGLMMSASESSMIQSLYIKSVFVPDDNKTTKRHSEEIKVSAMLTKDDVVSKKSSQPFVTNNGVEVVFHPVNFKFSKPLIYDGIPKQTVEDKSLLIKLCLRQKYTYKSFNVADVTLPLKQAVTKIVKEKFPLRHCHHVKLPGKMVVLSEVKSSLMTSSDSNLQPLKHLNVLDERRPASDINLQESLSWTGSSPSVSICIPEENELDADVLANVVSEIPCQSEITIEIPGTVNSEPDGPESVAIDKGTTDISVAIGNSENPDSDQHDHHLHVVRVHRTPSPQRASRQTDRFPTEVSGDDTVRDIVLSMDTETGYLEAPAKIHRNINHARIDSNV